MALLGLEDIKVHLGIEPEETLWDAQLESYIAAAERACELRTGRWIVPDDAPQTSKAAPFSEADLSMLRHAARLMVGEWFANRDNSVVGQVSEIPLGVRFLLDPLRDFSDR